MTFSRCLAPLHSRFVGSDDSLLGEDINFDKMIDVMNNAISSKSVQTRKLQMISNFAVRLTFILCMWLVFTRGKFGPARGIVMSIDCRAMRPLSFLLHRFSPECAADDWVCAAESGTTCGISYILATVLCNGAIVAVTRIWKGFAGGQGA